VDFLDDKLIRELNSIRDQIMEGTYRILSKPQWDEDSRVLSNSGAALLNEIEQERDSVRKLKIPFLFFRVRKRLVKLEEDYDEIAKHFDLFFDSGMRWLKTILEGNRYAEYQSLTKNYVAGLVEHCRKASDYLSDLISSKRNQYFHFQIVLIALVALFVAALSFIVSTLP